MTANPQFLVVLIINLSCKFISMCKLKHSIYSQTADSLIWNYFKIPFRLIFDSEGSCNTIILCVLTFESLLCFAVPKILEDPVVFTTPPVNFLALVILQAGWITRHFCKFIYLVFKPSHYTCCKVVYRYCFYLL